MLAPLIAAIVWIGVYPQAILRRTENAAAGLIQVIKKQPPAQAGR